MHAYLVNTGKVLNEETKKNPSNHPPRHLQHASQEIVPSGAWKDQQSTLQTVYFTQLISNTFVTIDNL